MTILEMINDKIIDLRKNSQEELNRTANILNIINNSIEALSDEMILKDYDFSIAINLVNSNSFGIIDLEKNIKDVKNILIAKYNYKQIFLTMSEENKQAIKSFKERLGYLKEEFEKRIEEQSKIKVDEDVLENLLDLKNLLEGKGRRKYYTYEMLEALFEVIDYDGFSYEDMRKLLKELSVSKNIVGKIEEDVKDFNDVLSLLKKYLGPKLKIEMLEKYQNEICSRIDLVNAENILKFFKDNHVINKFSFISILQIVLYGKYEYIKDFYYEKVVSKNDNIKEIYFEEAMSCVWINEKTTKRRYGTSIKRKTESGKKIPLYATIHEVCDDDVWENIRLLKENEDILDDKYDLSIIDYLWVITKPTWLIRKNIELFRIFNISDVKLSALVQNDLEDKIHFVTELGLLNTPRTYVFKEIEKNVPGYEKYMLNGKRKKNYNGSILNYYGRNTSGIGKVSYSEYIYWFYKMLRSGKEEFYKDFFSNKRAGERVNSSFNELEKYDIDELIMSNFVTDYYDVLIPDYNIYDEVIKEYNVSIKGDLIIPYFDQSILNEDIISKLEANTAIDIYSTDGEIKKVNNPYIYLFNTNIISRYKVLRNLSILKDKFGYLNDNMLLTAIVRGSYIDKNIFDEIKNTVMQEGWVK